MLYINHVKILVSSLYRDEILFSIKIMGFPSGFLFCKKKSQSLYGEKRKFRPYIETKLQFLHGLYGGINFFQDFLRYTNKNQRNFYLR